MIFKILHQWALDNPDIGYTQACASDTLKPDRHGDDSRRLLSHPNPEQACIVVPLAARHCQDAPPTKHEDSFAGLEPKYSIPDIFYQGERRDGPVVL
eukprot:5348256-Amphidinium_carterae.1